MSESSTLLYLVEDEPLLAELISANLQKAGYRLEIFQDPLLAYAAFESADPKPALVITDFNMPGMNGIQFLERCKALMPALKTICMSGTVTPDVLGRFDTKPDTVLSKPCPSRLLLSAVAQLVSGEGGPRV